MNKIFRVQIVLGASIVKVKHVVARHEKAALLRVIESMPEDDPAWQAAGWQDISVSEAHEAFIL